MPRRHSVSDARRNLSKLIREAENGKTLELIRGGKTVAVLMGHKNFRRLSANRPGFAAAYRDFMDAFDLAELDLDPDVMFGDIRDMTPGH